MDFKIFKLLKEFAFFIIKYVIIIIGGLVIFSSLDRNTRSTVLYGKYIDTDLSVNKKEYKLNQNVYFSFRFHQDKESGKYPVEIKMCHSESTTVDIKVKYYQRIENKYKDIFPIKLENERRFWTGKDIALQVECPNNLDENNYMLFNRTKSYTFNIKFKFIKQNNKYFLVYGDKYIPINDIPYYEWSFSSERTFMSEFYMSEGTASDLLDKYFYMRVKDDILYIKVSDYDKE